MLLCIIPGRTFYRCTPTIMPSSFILRGLCIPANFPLTHTCACLTGYKYSCTQNWHPGGRGHTIPGGKPCPTSVSEHPCFWWCWCYMWLLGISLDTVSFWFISFVHAVRNDLAYFNNRLITCSGKPKQFSVTCHSIRQTRHLLDVDCCAHDFTKKKFIFNDFGLFFFGGVGGGGKKVT